MLRPPHQKAIGIGKSFADNGEIAMFAGMGKEIAGTVSEALEIGLSPSGHVRCVGEGGNWQALLEQEEAAGVIALAGGQKRFKLTTTPTVVFWREFASAFLRTLCHVPEGTAAASELPLPGPSRLAQWVLQAPPMPGGEYLCPPVIEALWRRLEAWAEEEIRAKGSLSAFLQERAPAWSLVGRVTIHLAENKADADYPFAFMASYASDMNAAGRLRQLPLGQALREYAGQANKAVLLKLLEPLERATRLNPFMATLVESGDVYHPLAWTEREAYAFLQSIPACEEAGLLVRVPDWWRQRSRHPQVTATVGEAHKSKLGLEALLDFRLEVNIDGHRLSPDEIEHLLDADDGLVLFRGRWVEVNREKLAQALEHWKRLEAQGEISFAEGMRLLAEAPDAGPDDDALPTQERSWAFARPGTWLADTLRQMREPTGEPVPVGLRAVLRPYQIKGLDWLWFCARVGLGVCLADDMGLGKTLQVLAALQRKKETQPTSPPALLIVPASLIGNWKREAERFTPELRLHIAHRSEGGAASAPDGETLSRTDLVVTTYGTLTRMDWPTLLPWSWIILDEAQAIKNANTRQSKAVRSLRGQARFVLTGTPVENHLGDLWALFDFINPGLLGNASEFKAFTKRLREDDHVDYGPLRRLVGPYILRRLKTDRAVISDLPAKTEMKVFCSLTPAQARLYRQNADRLVRELENADGGIQRRGLVLAALMRFKQVCNHPDQLTASGDFAPEASGKFQRLGELCDEIASRGEKALVFTQFRELTAPIENHLTRIFGRAGLVLHGGTPVKERPRLVEHFQDENGPPFFVLSLKAGGTGLNLTAASHVIHFDRWWNPAVENQATDRAFRIGQKRNVLVHKFVTAGTLEEKIDRLISEKQDTAEAILSKGAEKALTEMNDAELLDFIRLDFNATDIKP